MRLLVIRHGESEADLLRVHEGRADFLLTDLGRRQAAAMSAWVAPRFPVCRIYSSPLRRAVMTAEALSMTTGVPIRFDADLREFDNGLLAGMSYEEANRVYPKVEGLPIDQAVYGMESQLAFYRRAERVLNRILSECPPEGTVAVVSHGGLICRMFRAFVGLPPESTLLLKTGDTGIHLWIEQKGLRVVGFSNSQEHLTEDLREQ